MSKTLKVKTNEQMSEVQATLEAMMETMIDKLREEAETSRQSHDDRFAQMNREFTKQQCEQTARKKIGCRCSRSCSTE